MKSFSFQSVRGTFIFAAGIIASIFGCMDPGNKFLGGVLLAISLGYLLGGWYYLKSYYPEGQFFLLFIMGFLYSSVFMAFTFFTGEWPLAKAMISIAPVWALLQILITFAIRKRLEKEGFIQFLIEGGLMLLLSLFLLTKS